MKYAHQTILRMIMASGGEGARIYSDFVRQASKRARQGGVWVGRGTEGPRWSEEEQERGIDKKIRRWSEHDDEDKPGQVSKENKELRERIECVEKDARIRMLQRSVGQSHSRDSAIDTDLQVPVTVFWFLVWYRDREYCI